jgi:hypothetical protein
MRSIFVRVEPTVRLMTGGKDGAMLDLGRFLIGELLLGFLVGAMSGR